MAVGTETLKKDGIYIEEIIQGTYGCLGISVNQFFRLWTGVERYDRTASCADGRYAAGQNVYAWR